MEPNPPQVSIGPVLDALEMMRSEGVIDKYAIGGAFAAILHAEPISTIDLDIFFLFEKGQAGPILSLETLYDFARGQGFSFDHEFINIHGWLVQFIESSNNLLWTEAVETAEPFVLEGRKILVIDKEHLAASWLLAGRAKDFNKIAMFVSAGIMNQRKLQDVLERHGLSSKWIEEKWRFSIEN